MPQELILKIHDSKPARELNAPIGSCSIGRGEENDVVIDAPGVSRRHAVIAHYSDDAQISDCNSQNGTFVNGRQ
ncbi:MAG TPA: FHA domain-containing protein, partial [Blastocatellia bacterium]